MQDSMLLFLDPFAMELVFRRVHPEVKGKPSCDEAILAKLNDKGNQNDDDIDPRWSALKKLK